ncbi:hypothetical protein R2G56_04960 [Nitratireductor aquimarinus]|uniref:Uncharacterized protein n=1 Tax=Nitratireductor aquimarinus TaxID=889300 RepID=A0ABU4AHA2_9HYPH|nr:hypothetical protein [Nitratireductor aquimarinus]MDV6225629.1 hypothetical protein [Nitratireductor aquimarinus]
MKGAYRGRMSVDELFQALFQDRSFFEEHGITHLRSASLYFTPCDEHGNDVHISDRMGRTVEGYETAGCYQSAADGFDKADGLEPRTVSVKTSSRARGGKKDRRRPKP